MNNVPRLLEAGLIHWLNKRKALIITCARQVGKTTLLEQLFRNKTETLWLNADEDTVRERLDKRDIPSLVNIVGNYKTVVIDEVQRIANAGLLLKILIDNFKDVQFIATGSSALDISETIFEPLTGRHLLFHLYPFSLTELYDGRSPFEIEQQLPFHLIYGNYPEVCNDRPYAKTLLTNLTNQYLYKDVLVWKDIRKPELLNKLLKLLAFQVGSEVSIHELSNQLMVKSETIESYINLLEKSFVVFRLQSYSTNSRKEVTKMSKIFFWDNGIRNSIINQFEPLSARNDVGKLWENLMVSERMKLNLTLQSDIQSYFWRNYNQSEVDYVELNQNKLAAFEMKWNTKSADKVSKAFVNQYPNAEVSIITPASFTKFCGID